MKLEEKGGYFFKVKKGEATSTLNRWIIANFPVEVIPKVNLVIEVDLSNCHSALSINKTRLSQSNS